MAKKRKRRYSRSSARCQSEMKRYKRGTAKSGRGGKGGKVKSRKQAIAIGLSKARKRVRKCAEKILRFLFGSRARRISASSPLRKTKLSQGRADGNQACGISRTRIAVLPSSRPSISMASGLRDAGILYACAATDPAMPSEKTGSSSRARTNLPISMATPLRRNIKRASSAIARWKLLPKGPDEAGERRGRKRRAVLTSRVVPTSVTPPPPPSPPCCRAAKRFRELLPLAAAPGPVASRPDLPLATLEDRPLAEQVTA